MIFVKVAKNIILKKNNEIKSMNHFYFQGNSQSNNFKMLLKKYAKLIISVL